MKRIQIYGLTVIAALSLGALLAVPGTPLTLPTQPPTSTLILNQDGYQFEVKLNPGSHLIHVDTLGTPHRLPQKLSLSLFHDPSTGQTVELKALAPLRSNDLPQYSGNLDRFSGPYFAVELQFPIPGTAGDWKRIKEEIPPTS